MEGDGRGRRGGEETLNKKEDEDKILLMVQKSGESPVDMVVYPIIYRVFIHPRWLAAFLPSTVCHKV